MPRFFVSKSDIADTTVTITGADAHHLSYSLRMAVGDPLSVLDGEGWEYLCRLSFTDGKRAEAQILERRAAAGESPVRVHLFQGYPKSDKLEFIIQKAVELGACAVTPFESTFCVKRPKSDKVDAKRERHARIATEAAKQCGRGILPTVYAPLSFDEMLKKAASYPLALFCYEGEGTESIKTVLSAHPDVREIAVIVGSEGGFSEKEAAAAKAAGLVMTGLGARILRCETAPLCVLSAISYAYEL